MARPWRTTLSLRKVQSRIRMVGECLLWSRRFSSTEATADLEFDDDEAGLGPVEEQQVDVAVVGVDLEVVLPADEREAVAELEQERLKPVDQGALELAFGGGLGEGRGSPGRRGRGSAGGRARCRRRVAGR